MEIPWSKGQSTQKAHPGLRICSFEPEFNESHHKGSKNSFWRLFVTNNHLSPRREEPAGSLAGEGLARFFNLLFLFLHLVGGSHERGLGKRYVQVGAYVC